MTTDPIVAEIIVPGRPMQAFVGFTAQMGEWWDPLLTPDPPTFTSVEIDPDGEVAMVHGDERYVWGKVRIWEPQGHYVQDFWLGHGEVEASLLNVRFTQDPAGTLVRLVHSGWVDGSEDVRRRYLRWDNLLQRFRAHVS